ncbi:MAG: PTS sugar transporter subunit IIA [Pseudomonadota bacterium]
MNVGILIISHDGIGEALLATAMHMIGKTPLNVKLLEATRKCDPDDLLDQATSLIEQLDEGSGILVLTDLLGSTPSNIAHRLGNKSNVNIVTGINLSMIIRILNYPDLNLDDLTDKAFSGGVDGINIVRGET